MFLPPPKVWISFSKNYWPLLTRKCELWRNLGFYSLENGDPMFCLESSFAVQWLRRDNWKLNIFGLGTAVEIPNEYVFTKEQELMLQLDSYLLEVVHPLCSFSSASSCSRGCRADWNFECICSSACPEPCNTDRPALCRLQLSPLYLQSACVVGEMVTWRGGENFYVSKLKY